MRELAIVSILRQSVLGILRWLLAVDRALLQGCEFFFCVRPSSLRCPAPLESLGLAIRGRPVRRGERISGLAVIPLIILGVISILATGGGGSSAGGGAGVGQTTPFRLLATDTDPSLFYQVEASSGTSMLISGIGLR